MFKRPPSARGTHVHAAPPRSGLGHSRGQEGRGAPLPPAAWTGSDHVSLSHGSRSRKAAEVVSPRGGRAWSRRVGGDRCSVAGGGEAATVPAPGWRGRRDPLGQRVEWGGSWGESPKYRGAGCLKVLCHFYFS